MNEVSPTAERIPDYLKRYVVAQDYDAYTPEDHATWRFIMRNARANLKELAHPIYLEGLKKTGIPVDRIPRISDMDAVLNRFGWGAVCVCGFIPPLAFLDFQARRILPIAADMRTANHLAYTPAPDIVHEAAGHAPIIADPGYAEYLTQYASMARMAIYSYEDVRLYEAIRELSDVKENPDSTAEEIARSEKKLDDANAQMTWTSEAALISRMFWWTAEYGLIGDLDNPKIYGAGLLSSISEGQDCLGTKVKKIPLSAACTKQTYDITKPQPQLFVAKDFEHLTQVLKEVDATLAYRNGGAEALQLAQKARALTTTVLDSGLQITGVVDQFEVDGEGIDFVRWSGPVQLAFEGEQIGGQGRDRHPEGFSAPFGRWKGASDVPPCELSDEQLAQCGLIGGEHCRLEFDNGFALEGTLARSYRNPSDELMLLTFLECTVWDGSGNVRFQPEWGEFDLAVGCRVPSVFGGPADWEAYGDYDMGSASTQPGRRTPYTAAEQERFELYRKLKKLRTDRDLPVDEIAQQLPQLASELAHDHPDHWLGVIEIAEVSSQRLGTPLTEQPWAKPVLDMLVAAERARPDVGRFTKAGLALADVTD